jgi:adenylyltransferase/sulfurtransferase
LGIAPGHACYRCYFERPPDARLLHTCETIGVLGPAAGVMGAWMTGVAWGLHTDPSAHAGKLHALDLRTLRPQQLHAPPREGCDGCHAVQPLSPVGPPP